jgi:hypothetical protein
LRAGKLGKLNFCSKIQIDGREAHQPISAGQRHSDRDVDTVNWRDDVNVMERGMKIGKSGGRGDLDCDENH